MDWTMSFTLLLGALIFLLLVGVPVAFAFLAVNFIAAIVLMGGQSGPQQIILSIYDSLAKFTLAPIPLFIIMGEILFHSGLAQRALDVLVKYLGAIPGRLSVLATISGAIFAALSGSSMANTAMLGSLLVPEMERRGYSKSMSLGPVMASGTLAMVIPPSALAVLLGSLGQISIGKLLIGGIIPGITLAAVYMGYIIIRCILDPSLAPTYPVPPTPLAEKLFLLVRDVIPLGALIFLAVGLIFLGVATPTEAAALGAAGALVISLLYRKMNFRILMESMKATVNVTVMIFIIIAGASAYSQILAFSGASRGLVEAVLSLPLPPIMVLIVMMLIVLFLGCFMEQTCILMITLPLFMPIVNALGFNTVWFGILMLIELDVGQLSPPFGLSLFVMKGVAPPKTTMSEIFASAIPFVVLDVAVIALLMAAPGIVLWLPNMIR